MWKVQYKSVLTGEWVDSHLGNYSTERRACNAARTEFDGRYEWRVKSAVRSHLSGDGCEEE